MTYICPNCKKEMFEDVPGILQCHNNGCEEKMMKDDYDNPRILGTVTTCWKCPYLYDKISRACNLTGQEIGGGWVIDPSCPLKRLK